MKTTHTSSAANRRFAPFLLAAALGLAAPLGVSASGSYCVCIPKPPQAAAGKVDKDKYNLGQKVFNGKTAAAQGDAAAQRAKLSSLQSQLPEKVGKKTDLNALAGKLTAEQLSALEYYVQQRYPAGK